jgi:hypothetical protein
LGKEEEEEEERLPPIIQLLAQMYSSPREARSLFNFLEHPMDIILPTS